MRFGLLGPLEVHDGEGAGVDVGRPQQRALLALLLCRANRVVSVAEIAEGLWGDDPPASAANSVQGYVSRLRRVLGAGALVTATPGYRLEVDPESIDTVLFERMVAEGRSALSRGEPTAAAAAFGRALALRRGPPLAEFEGAPFAGPEAARLDSIVRFAEEELIEARLALGEAAGLVPELEQMVRLDPLRERAWGQLMTALYRCGRQADALAAFQRARTVLVEALGLEPGPALRRIEAEVLSQTLQPPVLLPRGSVSFLLTDIEGSTRLWEADPAAMSRVLSRHDAIVAEVVAAHRGQLRKTRGEGDSTFSVFAQASDALAAAVALQCRLAAEPWPDGLGLAVRMVVHSGEAELRDGDYFGPAVNRAARTRSVAHGGQVLVTEAAAALASDRLGPGIGLRPLGRHHLKDLDRPELIYQLTHPRLAERFPPLATGSVVVRLPARLASFVGRAAETEQVAAAVGSNRLITLTGPGGCGKTSLAVAAAGRAAENDECAVWFVDLAPVRTPEAVVDAMAGTFGVRERPGEDLAGSVAGYLSSQEALLVVDNCEHVADAAAALVDAVLRAAPAVRVLATSREPLGVPGERNWPVPALAPPDAVRLFAERARAALPSFRLGDSNQELVAEVCARLDGMPLAIELAAARVGALSVDEIAARLDDALRLLGDAGRRGAARQQTLRATLEWSYQQLSRPEQILFDRLSVFAGGFGLEAVGAVGACDDVVAEDVTGFFARLIDKSLVVRGEAGPDGPARYRLLETLRQYGRRHLDEAGALQAVRAAHANHFLGLVEQAEEHYYLPGSRRWFDQIALEHDNFAAALDWALDDKDAATDVGARLVGALGWAWFVDGQIAEGRTWAQAALAATDGQFTLVRGRVVLAACVLATAQSDLEVAAQLATELNALGETLDSAYLRANGTDLLGIARWGQGRIDESIALHAKASVLHGSYGNRWDEAVCGGELGRALTGAGRFEEACAALDLAVERARALGEDTAIGFTLDAAATLRLRLGDLDLAAALISEAVAHYRTSGYQEGVASGLNSQAQVALRSGERDAAAAGFGEALELCRRLGHLGGAASALAGLAEVADRAGQRLRAVELAAAADALRARAGVVLSAAEQAAADQLVDGLRSRLDRDAFQQAWARGQATTVDRASELAAHS